MKIIKSLGASSNPELDKDINLNQWVGVTIIVLLVTIALIIVSLPVLFQ